MLDLVAPGVVPMSHVPAIWRSFRPRCVGWSRNSLRPQMSQTSLYSLSQVVVTGLSLGVPLLPVVMVNRRSFS